MPPIDPENLVSITGPCNTNDDPKTDDPPQSFWLSQDAEFDWFDRNAVLDRKDSTKGNSNSNTTPSHLSNSTSLRLPVNKSILALPKVMRSGASDVKQKRIRTGLTLFPRRSTSTAEPSSPKVSCMGRVRSKRDNAQQKTVVIEGEKMRKKKKKSGFWKSVVSIFRSSKHERDASPAAAAVHVLVRSNDELSEPAGLMLTKRFVSGRRPDSWIGNLDSEKETTKTAGTVVRQGSVGPLCDLNCGPGVTAAVPAKL